jgi:hypothetical protein
MLLRHCFATFLELKLNSAHQLFVYASGVNILGGSVHNIKNREALMFACKKNGLKVNIDKTKCMNASRVQNAGTIHRIEINNKFLEILEQPNSKF